MILRTVFMGSPGFAVPSLKVVHQHTQILSVVCQPDKPSGRGLAMTAPAVKEAALALGLPILQPASIRPQKSNFVEQIAALEPDAIIVVAYGKILPKEMLAIPKHGCFNVHGSILPTYRGAAPIQWALIQGETKTGVTLMKMDEGMDTGPTYFSKAIKIAKEDTALTLGQKLSLLGAEILSEGLLALQAGMLPSPMPQDSSQATLAPLLSKEHGFIDFTRPAALVSGQIRGVDPWPGAYTTLPKQAEPLKLFTPQVVEGNGYPGEFLGYDEKGLHIACAEGAVAISEVQLPGRKRMDASAFMAGYQLPFGTIFGDGRQNPLLCQ